MKKIIIALLAMSMVSTPVFAEDTASEAWEQNVGTIDLSTLTSTGTGVSISGGTVTVTKGGDFTVTGTLPDGMIHVNTDEKVKLRLSGASITNTTGPAIYFENTEKALVTLTENTENSLTDGETYSNDAKAALFSNDDMEIKGSGSLTVKANYNHGITSDDDLDIQNGVITINSKADGLHANDSVTISGETTLNITAQDDGIQSESLLTIDGGIVNINSPEGKGITGVGDVTVNSGTINIANATEGIESEATLTINGGDISINCTDDGLNAGGTGTGGFGGGGGMRPNMQVPTDGTTPPISGTATDGTVKTQGQHEQGRPQMDSTLMPPADAGEMPQMNGGMRQNISGDQTQKSGTRPSTYTTQSTTITDTTATDVVHAIIINGGTVYICAGGDGIDSNGDLTFNGGAVYVDGPMSGGDSAIDSDGIITSNGGTLVAVGGTGMLRAPNASSTQNVLKAVFDTAQTANSIITIKDTDGNTILEYSPKTAYQSIVYSSDTLKKDTSYTISVDGTQVSEFTATDTVTTVGSAVGGNMGGGKGGMGNRQTGSKSSGIRVQLNGTSLSFDQEPVIENDTTLVPFRAIFEALGMDIEWNNELQTITATKDDLVLELSIGSTTASKSGELIQLSAAPTIIGERTMIPVRFIAESLGMNVEWQSDTSTVEITQI